MRDPRPSSTCGGHSILHRIYLSIGLLSLLLVPSEQKGKNITGLDVSVGYKNIYNLDPHGNETVCVNWQSGSNKDVKAWMTIDVNITVPDDRCQLNIKKKQACFSMTPDLFPDFGIHDLMVYVSNKYGKAEKDVYIYYEEEPDGLEVDNKTVYVNIDQVVNLTAKLQNGTNIKAEWMVSVDDSNLIDFHDVVRQIYHVRHFNEVALHNVSLIVANELTSKVQFFNVCVQHHINGISLQPSTTIKKKTNEEVTVFLKIAGDADLPMGYVTAEVTFDDGDNRPDSRVILEGIQVEANIRNTSELKKIDTEKLGKSENFTYKYEKQGTYTVTAVLSSQTETQTHNVTVEIWDDLDKIELKTKKDKPYSVNDVVEVQLEGYPENIFSYTMDYGDGTVIKKHQSNYKQKYISQTLSHVYNTSGKYLMKLNAFNKEKSHEKTLEVEVCDPIPVLELQPETKQVTTVDGDVNYTVLVAEGIVPKVTCTVDFNDGTKKSMELRKNYQFRHNFVKPGNYNVSIKCIGKVNSRIAEANVVVLPFTVNDFELHNEKLWPMNVSVPINVSFTFAIKQFKDSKPPDGVTVRWDYGDGSTTENTPLKTWTSEHVYTERGVYNGSVLITHGKHSTTLNFTVRLGLITMTVDTNAGLVNEDAFNFTVMFPKELNFQYKVICGDNEEEKLKQSSHVTHIYHTSGIYRAYVVGWNDTVSEEFHLTQSLTVDNRIENGLSLHNPDKIYFPPGNMNLTIDIPDGKADLKDINCEIHFGDDIDQQMYNFTGDISKDAPSIQNYTYKTLGIHNITVNCSNMLSSTLLLSKIEVINMCFSTEGIFDRQYSQASTPRMAFTHVPVQIRGNLDVSCYNKGPDYYWEIYKVEGDKRVYIPITQSYSDFVQLQQGTLRAGLYEISLNISFTHLSNNWFVEKTYLRYRDPNLISGIDGGAMRVITKKDILIDAAALSYDPITGQGEVAGLQFDWKCYTVNTQSIQALATRQKEASIVNCANFTMPVRNGVLMFYGSRQDTKGFVFEVVVKKGDRKSTPSRQLVQLLKDAPIIKIRCLINCEMKTAVSTDLSIDSMCTSCTEDEKRHAKYAWTLKKQSPGSDLYIEVPDFKTKFRNTGENPGSVVIKRKTLEPAGKYRLEVEVTVPGKKHPGFSSLDLIINTPPWGGRCVVTPEEGHAGETEFVVTCSGWQDEGYRMTAVKSDLEEPKEYSYALRKGDFFYSIIDHTGATSPKRMLPTSKKVDDDTAYTIEVKIVDVMKDYTIFPLPITLKPPTIEGLLVDEAVLKSKEGGTGGVSLDALSGLDQGGMNILDLNLDSFAEVGNAMIDIAGEAGGDGLGGAGALIALASDLTAGLGGGTTGSNVVDIGPGGGGNEQPGVGQPGMGSNAGNMGGGNVGLGNSGLGNTPTEQGRGLNSRGMGQGTGQDLGGVGEGGGSNIWGNGRGARGNMGGMRQGTDQNMGGIRQGTGQNMEGIRQGTDQNMGGMRQGTGQNMVGMRQGTGQNMGGMRQGTGQNMGGMRQGTGQNMGGMRQGTGQNMGGMRQGTGQNMGGIRQGTGQNMGGIRQGTGQNMGGSTMGGMGQSGSNIRGTGQGRGQNMGGMRQGTDQNMGGIRQGTNQNMGRIRQGTDQNMGGIRQGTDQNMGGIRQGTDQNMGGMRQSTGQNMGGMRQGTGQTMGGMRQGTGQNMGGSTMGGMGQSGSNIRGTGQGRGQNMGGTGQDTGQNMGGMGQGTGQNMGGMRQGIGQNMEGVGRGTGQNMRGVGQGTGQNMGGMAQDTEKNIGGSTMGGMGQSGSNIRGTGQGRGQNMGSNAGATGQIGGSSIGAKPGWGSNTRGQPAGTSINAFGPNTQNGIGQTGPNSWQQGKVRAEFRPGPRNNGLSSGRRQQDNVWQTGFNGAALNYRGGMNSGPGQGTYSNAHAAKREKAIIVREKLLTMRKEDRNAVIVAAIIHKGKKSLEQSKSTGDLLKSVHVVSTLASVINRIPVSEDTSLVTKTMKDGQSDNNWNELWDDYNKPKQSLAKKLLSQSSENMIDILSHSSNQVIGMNGDQIASLSGSLAMILQVPEKTTLEAAIKSTDLGLQAAVQLHNITKQRPYPPKEEVNHGTKGVVSFLGNVLQTTTPDSSLRMPEEITEDTMSTPEESSDTHYEENLFLMRKNAQANLMKKLKQANATKKVLPKIEKGIEQVLKTMETMVVKNEKALTFKSNALTLSVQKKTPSTINETIRTEQFEAVFVPPAYGQNFLEALKDPVIDTVVFKDNPYVNSADGSSDDITSSVLQLTLKDNETVIDAPLKLKIRTPKPPKEGVYRMKDTMSGPSQMMYHRFLLRNSQDSTFIYVRVPKGVSNVTGYLRAGRAPTMLKYDVRVTGVQEEWKGKDAYKIIIPANSVDNGTVYLALKMTFLPGTILERKKREAMTDVSDADFASDHGDDYIQFNTSEAVYAEMENGEYGLVIVTDGCRVWDPEKEIWDAKSCVISRFSTPEETFCSCENSPGKTFATTFYVPPNTIDFSLVFTKFDPSNAAVYSLIIGIIVMYIFGLIWARRQDKRDIERWRVGYLMDNLSTDKYFYLLQVHTGLRKNSGTDSRISFVLAGENGDTGVRILSDGKRSVATGSVMNYILAVPRQLSDLSYLRIWHDNSGSGSKASWFLNKIVAEDLQTQQRYIFVCDHWLAVDKEEGLIDRVLPVSVKDDFMTFDKLFSEHARLNITDTHLWLSIFMRPERCTFSRVQRVSCCLALMFLMMIASAMFFKSAAEKEDEETIRHEVKIGALRFSMTSFYVSLVGLMVTMPPTILLVMIFKSSKPKHKKGEHFTRAKSLQQQDAENDVLANRYRNKPLPHFFVYIAWLLLLLIVMTSGFFLILYSMQWGREVSEEWLTSFFMCFAQSVVVMDPLKVVILAILLAFCLRDPFDSKGEIDIARVETEARLLGKDELDLLLPPEPLPPDVLAKARRRRRKEVRAQSVFLELIQYIIFLFAIYSLSFGNRDDRSFMIHEHIENNLYTGSVNVEYPFEGIQSYDNFFTWAQSTFIPRLFPETDLRGSRLPWRKRLFFSDLTNFRVGPARIRQLRMPRHQSPFYGSQYSSLVSNQNYYGAYSLFSEDVNSYCLRWKKMPCPFNEETKYLTSKAWKYTSSSDVWGLPVAGQYKIYSGGGYMLELNVNYDVSKDMLQELYDNSWLDRRTRAVFVEFTLYNAFVNIMAYVRLAAEFPETGSTIIWHDIMTFRLDQHHGSLGAYVLLCEIVIAVILVMFTITLMKKLWEQKIGFFLHVWQTLDLLTVIWCMIAVVFYVIREINASETLTRFRDNPKKFVNFQHIAVWDNLFIYALGALVFSTTIRILRILGYNKRVTIIAAVLSNSAKDLTGFGIVFGIVFFAYVLSGYILFSAHYYGYHTIYDSMFTIFTYMLGKNIMARLMLVAPIWAQIYFSTLVFFIIFVLLTMFQAIMNNSMTVVRDNLKKVPPPYGLVNVVLNIYRALIRDWLPDSFFKNQQKDNDVMEELRRRPTYQVLSNLRDQLNLAVTVKGAFKKPIDMDDDTMDRGSLEAKLLRTSESKEYGLAENVRQLDIQLKGRDPGKGSLLKDLAGQRNDQKPEKLKENQEQEKERDRQMTGDERPGEHGGREKGRRHGGQRSRDSSGHGQTKEPEVRVERSQRRRQRIEQ